MDWNSVLQQFVYPALVSAVSAFVLLLLNSLKAWVKRKTASDNHWAAAEIVLDSVQAILPEFLQAIKDGKLTDAEKASLKAKAIAIAKPRLVELSGFAREKLGKWLEDQVEISLGKLISLLGITPSSQGDTGTIGPDTPASE